jgi:hypothetical protein
MDANVMKMYSRPLTPMGTMVLRATFGLIFSSEPPSPAKNRNRETWRNPGTASATFGMYNLSHPSYKYCRSRELFKGSPYRWKTCIYLRTHCWTRIARSAARRLKARAMNQKTLTRTSDANGLNGGKGGGGVEGMATCGAIEDSCTEI